MIAGAPNVHRLLERGGVEYLQRTAGKFKRTINVLTPNTEEGVAAFEKELEVIHTEFKQTVVQQRPLLAQTLDEVATGYAMPCHACHAMLCYAMLC